MLQLRSYQQEVAAAVLASIQDNRGLTFTVEIARQGGKNELSAILEVMLLTLYLDRGGTIIKASPTFKPQTVISMDRLKRRLNDFGLRPAWRSEMGYIVAMGAARAVFLSADNSSNVVGHTADILLEMDEAQDIARDKYAKEFRPMGAATNCTTVLYGTAWDDTTLLEEVKQSNLELQRRDGLRRHFSYDWQEVARHNPAYRAFVLAERDRLGESHPLFRTQYALLPVAGGNRFLDGARLAQVQGRHARRSSPAGTSPHTVYVAGVDIAGEDMSGALDPSAYCPHPDPLRDGTPVPPSPAVYTWPAPSPAGQRTPADQLPADDLSLHSPAAGTSCGPGVAYGTHPDPLPAGEGTSSPSRRPTRDATAIVIAAVTPTPAGPSLEVVDIYTWTGRPHHEAYPQMVDLLKRVWDCRRIVVDATGIGEPVAGFLAATLGRSRVHPFKFTAPSKSELGFNLLAAVNSGRLRLFAPDGSPEYAGAMQQLQRARAVYRPNRTLNFFVDPSEGHDDILMALALAVEAAGDCSPKKAKGSIRQGGSEC